MKTRKTLLLAMAALCASALAAPAVASGEAKWTKNEALLMANEEVTLSGPITIETTGEDGIACEVEIYVTLEPGETGTVTGTNFQSPCLGLGELENCEYFVGEAANLPWTIHAQTNTQISITNFFVYVEMGGIGCPSVSANANEVFGTFDNSQLMSELQPEGTVSTSLGPFAELNGLLKIEPKEVFGIKAEA